MTGKTYWQKLDKIGWLEYLPKEMHDDVRSQLEINLKDKEHPGLVCMALAQGGFEAGCADGESVLGEFARISNGAFRPTQIKIKPVKKDTPCELSFHHDKKKHACLISSEFDNLPSPDYDTILKVVNQALIASEAKESFFALPVADVYICLVFVPPPIYKAAVKANLIPREVVWSREDAVMFNDFAMDNLSSDPEFHDGKMAVKNARQAVSLDPGNHTYMETLAAAYADVGNFKEAVRWQRLAMKDKNIPTEDALQRLELYRNKQPYRFPITPVAEPLPWPQSMSSSIK